MTGDLRDLHTFINTCRADGMLPVDSIATVSKCGSCRVYPKNNTQQRSNTNLRKIDAQGTTNLVLSYLILTSMVMSCLVLSSLVLFCFLLVCLVLSSLHFRSLHFRSRVLSCLALTCLALSCLVLFCLVASCLVLSWIILSCLVLSCIVLSCFASVTITVTMANQALHHNKGHLSDIHSKYKCTGIYYLPVLLSYCTNYYWFRLYTYRLSLVLK